MIGASQKRKSGPAAWRSADETCKVRRIEEEFKRLMFDVADV